MNAVIVAEIYKSSLILVNSVRQCFKPSVIRAVTQLVMAFHPNYMVPMFSIPQVTWANQSLGQTSVGRFPNPKSVMRICKYRECSQDSTLIFVLTIESFVQILWQ